MVPQFDIRSCETYMLSAPVTEQAVEYRFRVRRDRWHRVPQRTAFCAKARSFASGGWVSTQTVYRKDGQFSYRVEVRPT